MRKKSKVIILFILLIIILLSMYFFWFIPEKSDSYAEPNEAILAMDQNLLLIPGYKLNDDSLYFFIKDHEHLGASYAQKGFFGWKAELLSWSQMEGSFEDFSGYQMHGTQLIYGLLKYEGDRFVEVNGERAVMLNLAMLGPDIVTEYNLEDMYIWYFESDTALDQLESIEIKLFDGDTNELIGTY